MNSEELSKARARVIERTINIEWLIGSIICQNYFGRIYKNFFLEVLYDELFSFGLKRRILEKIVTDIDRRQLQNLNRLNTIRNYFAHCNQVLIEGQNPTDENAKSGVPDPRKIQFSINFEEMFKEFEKIAGPVEAYLAQLFSEKGGELLSKDDFKDY